MPWYALICTCVSKAQLWEITGLEALDWDNLAEDTTEITLRHSCNAACSAPGQLDIFSIKFYVLHSDWGIHLRAPRHPGVLAAFVSMLLDVCILTCSPSPGVLNTRLSFLSWKVLRCPTGAVVNHGTTGGKQLDRKPSDWQKSWLTINLTCVSAPRVINATNVYNCVQSMWNMSRGIAAKGTDSNRDCNSDTLTQCRIE